MVLEIALTRYGAIEKQANIIFIKMMVSTNMVITPETQQNMKSKGQAKLVYKVNKCRKYDVKGHTQDQT